MFRQVVRRLHVGFSDETEIAIRVVGKAFGQVARFPGRGQLLQSSGDESVPLPGQHQAKTLLRRVGGTVVNDAEQFPQMFQEQRAVAAIVGIGMLHQEFHVADQMRQAELHEHMAVLHVLAVGAKVVTADQTVELLAEHVEQNLRATRGIDVENREERRPKAPRPQALPGVEVAGLIDVQARFLGQGAEQLLVGCFQAGTHFVHQLGQLSAADGDAHHVAEKSADGGERGMTDTLEKGHQRRQPRPRQAGLNDGRRHRGVMHAPTMATPVGQPPMFLDAQGHLDDLDLLEHAGSRVGLF